MTDPLVRIDSPQLTVEPGGRAHVRVLVENPGSIVESYRLEVLGDDARAWATVQPAELSVYPHQSAETAVVFAPPATGVTAGPRPFAIRATSTVDPQCRAVAEGDLAVAAVVGVAAVLRPVNSSGRSRGRHQLELVNTGNSPVRLRVRAQDPDERLQLEFDRDVVDLPPTGTATVHLTVRPRGGVLGKDARVPFRVTAQPDLPAGAPPTPYPSAANSRWPSLEGSFTRRAFLPPWTLPAVATTAVVGVLAAFQFGVIGNENDKDEDTTIQAAKTGEAAAPGAKTDPKPQPQPMAPVPVKAVKTTAPEPDANPPTKAKKVAPAPVVAPHKPTTAKAPASYVTRYDVAGMADWDNDGHTDMVIRDNDEGSMWLYPGTATAGFGGSLVKLGDGFGDATLGGIGIGIGDWDGDGNVDLVTTVADGRWLLYRGSGNRKSLAGEPVEIANNMGAYTILGLTDWDGDSRVDIIMRTKDGNSAYLAPGKATAGYGDPLVLLKDGLAGAPYIGFVDWDRDGHYDLVVKDKDYGRLSLYPGQGGRAPVGSPVEIGNSMSGYTIVGYTDWDRDSYVDVIFHHPQDGGLWIMPGKGLRGYGDHVEKIRDGLTRSTVVGIADWDGDKNPDAIVKNSEDARLHLYRGKGNRYATEDAVEIGVRR